MTSKTHKFKNAMRVYAVELICSTGVSGFQTFKPVFCICNKLRLHAEMLKEQCHDDFAVFEQFSAKIINLRL